MGKHYFLVKLEKPIEERMTEMAQKDGTNPLTVNLEKTFNNFHEL